MHKQGSIFSQNQASSEARFLCRDEMTASLTRRFNTLF
jgi:hypothetical protein